MAIRLSAFRRRHWILLALFLAAAAASGLFATRLVVQSLYWSSQHQEPIEGWMTLGYVAHAQGVPPWLLRRALGLPPEREDRRPLAEIATAQDLPLDALRLRLEHAIATARPPHPPPPALPPQEEDAEEGPPGAPGAIPPGERAP